MHLGLVDAACMCLISLLGDNYLYSTRLLSSCEAQSEQGQWSTILYGVLAVCFLSGSMLFSMKNSVFMQTWF